MIINYFIRMKVNEMSSREFDEDNVFEKTMDIYEKEYIDIFKEKWAKIVDKLYFKQEQFEIGFRLRPKTVYWGYMLANDKNMVSTRELEMIAELAICIELIHKSTIILDDYIDDDSARHGQNAFHIDYGVEKTMIFAMNIFGQVFKNLYNASQKYNFTTDAFLMCHNLLIQAICEMSTGELDELCLDDDTRYDIDKIKSIINFETATLFTNSLLMGYSVGKIQTSDTRNVIETIGRECGYIFQVLNDLEPFTQISKNIQHKGKSNFDFDRNKKNIGIAYLYQVISKKEKSALENLDALEKNKKIIELYQKYDVTNSFLQETTLVYKKIKDQILKIKPPIDDMIWIEGFSGFIDVLFEISKHRLY